MCIEPRLAKLILASQIDEIEDVEEIDEVSHNSDPEPIISISNQGDGNLMQDLGTCVIHEEDEDETSDTQS